MEIIRFSFPQAFSTCSLPTKLTLRSVHSPGLRSPSSPFRAFPTAVVLKKFTTIALSFAQHPTAGEPLTRSRLTPVTLSYNDEIYGNFIIFSTKNVLETIALEDSVLYA